MSGFIINPEGFHVYSYYKSRSYLTPTGVVQTSPFIFLNI